MNLTNLLLFFFGAAAGSFLNVVSLRYDPDKFLFGKHLLGRSACPNCKTTLKWFELIPILSFVVELGRCRSCRAKISWKYPLGEILGGLIFVLVYWRLGFSLGHGSAAPWIFVFLLLLLLSFIDARLKIIPDEINIILAVLGFFIALSAAPSFRFGGDSFIPSYALLFGLRENIVLNRLGALMFGILLFGFLILVTKGKGMGFGDLKLSSSLGVVFGWPDILFICAVGFILGSLYGAALIIGKSATLKSSLPFGVFLALSSFVVFLFGNEIIGFYFSLF